MLTLDMTTLEEDDREEGRDARRLRDQCTPGLGFPSGLGAEYPEEEEAPEPPPPAPGPQLQLVPVQDSEPPRARRILAVGARWRGLAPVILALASGCGAEPEAGIALQLVFALAGAAIFMVIS